MGGGEEAELALLLQPVGQEREPVARLERRPEPRGVVPEEERERRQDAGDELEPGAPRPAPRLPDAIGRKEERVERDREGERRASQEGETGEQPDQPCPARSPQLDQAGEG